MEMPEGMKSRFETKGIVSKLPYLFHNKFTIAFENESSYFYTTEKLFHPFMAMSVPIYWGNPDVGSYFNVNSFVNCHNFSSFE